MKLLTLSFLVLLASTTVNANSGVTANSTWSEILNNNQFVVATPSIPGGLFNVCLNEDDKFETINPVSKCTKYENVFRSAQGSAMGGYYQRECVSWTKAHLVTSREVTSKNCVQWDYRPGSNIGTTCRSYETTTAVRPLTYNVSVREMSTPGRNSNPASFKKSFTINTCK